MGVLKSLVLGNLHTVPMEGCWKFQKWGRGGWRVEDWVVLKGKLTWNLGIDFQPKYFPWGRMEIFWDKTVVGKLLFSNVQKLMVDNYATQCYTFRTYVILWSSSVMEQQI